MKFYWCLTITIYKYILYIFMIYASTCIELFAGIGCICCVSRVCACCAIYIMLCEYLSFIMCSACYAHWGPDLEINSNCINSISSIPFVHVVSARSIETVNLDCSTHPNFRTQCILWYHKWSNRSNWPVLVKIRKNGYPISFLYLL